MYRDNKTMNWFGETVEDQEKRRKMLSDVYDSAIKPQAYQSPLSQTTRAISDMAKEYMLMHSHDYKQLDDYYHCKANYNAANRGFWGKKTADYLGNAKEQIDYLKNRYYKDIPEEKAKADYYHDTAVNQEGINRALQQTNQTAQEACSDYRAKNKYLPRRYW
ncbi:MAG: hypothetical protein E7012_05950 [Alphaproteobacteria bacterium]|nr:hypothetical protein [Alphaproteobacteria bacterium]